MRILFRMQPNHWLSICCVLVTVYSYIGAAACTYTTAVLLQPWVCCPGPEFPLSLYCQTNGGYYYCIYYYMTINHLFSMWPGASTLLSVELTTATILALSSLGTCLTTIKRRGHVIACIPTTCLIRTDFLVGHIVWLGYKCYAGLKLSKCLFSKIWWCNICYWIVRL